MVKLLFALSILNTHPSFSERVKFENDSVQIKVILPKTKIANEKDLTLTLIVKSTQSTPLEIPKVGIWSYANRGPAFFLIELQRETKGKYVDVPGNASMDNVPETEIDTLYTNGTKGYPLSIRLLFHYAKGNYRLRVLATFSVLNKLPDIYSAWTYFECENDIKIKM
jgi:hypothetical protein